MIQIEWRVDGRRVSRSLGHRDWKRAEEQADQFADGRLRLTPRESARTNATPRPLTLGTLFGIYAEEVTPTKADLTQKCDIAATRMFLKYFGKNRDPSTLSQRDWDRFIRDRRSGTAGHRGKPVANLTIARDLTFLLAVLNWAAKWRDEDGKLLLETNPLRGLKTPTEKNPRRVVLKESEYQALLEVSPQVGWRFHVALVLAHETGHRIGAIRQLRWSDIDFDEGIIRWRAEHEKSGYRAFDAGHRRCDRRPQGSRAAQPHDRRRSRAPPYEGPVEEHQPSAGHELVEQGPQARRIEAETWPWLALAPAKVRI